MVKLLTVCLFGMLIFGSVMAQGEKYAYFSYHIELDTVRFTNLSHAPSPLTISSVAWDFADGGTSTLDSPDHVYFATLSNPVVLTVTWSDNSTSTYQRIIEPLSLQQVGPESFSKASYHDVAYVIKNSAGNAINVGRNDHTGPLGYTISMVGTPSNGTAVLGTGGVINYTPNNNFTGVDHFTYKAQSSNNVDTSHVFIHVIDGTCGYNMSLSPYFLKSGAHNSCTGALRHPSQPSADPAGSKAFGYKFIFNSPDSEDITAMNAFVEIDPGMRLDLNSGSLHKDRNLNPTDAIVNVVYDEDNNRVMFQLAPGETIKAGETYAYVFGVDVDSMPHGGAGKDYFASLTGNAACMAGTGRTIQQDLKNKESINSCKSNTMQVSPTGCGVWGDIAYPKTTELIYTIQFKDLVGTRNRVVIKDKLPQALDVNTVRVLGGYPHAPETRIVPADNQVQFEFDFFHPNDGPANDSLGNGGHVTFAVELKSGLPNGTPIDNWADIVYNDLNYRTDTTFSTIFAAPGPLVDLGADVTLSTCDSCIVLQAMPTGGSSNYTYLWTSGATTATDTVCAMDSTFIGLWVTDSSTGCTTYDRVNFDVDCNLINLDDAVRNQADVSVYPNPFSGATHFRVEVEDMQNISLKVFNSVGVKVAELYNGPAVPGRPLEVDFNASDLPAGMYFYNLSQENGNTQAGRLVIAK